MVKGQALALDLLGRELPPFVTRERVIEWTGHPDPRAVTLVAARAWSSEPGLWVAVAASRDVRVALLSVAGDASTTAAIQLVARTTGPMVPRPDWGLLSDGPADWSPESAGAVRERTSARTAENRLRAQSTGLDDNTEVVAFDFAPYRISASERAFGIRFLTHELYAGGGAAFEALTLLRVVKDRLVAVLDVPVSAEKTIAGDWHEDGTRDHEQSEEHHVIQVKPTGAQKFNEILLNPKTRDDPGESVRFVWNDQLEKYQRAR